MKKKLFVGILLSLNCAYGQQESQFASTFINPYMINPAAGGLYNVMQFDANTRMQWVGYQDGPKTIIATGHTQIKIGNSSSNEEFNAKDVALFGTPKMTTGSAKHIVGGKLMNDAIGPFAKTSVQGSYAIHLPFTKTINVGLGLGLGWSNFRLNDSRVILDQPDDDAYYQYLSSSGSQNIGDINAGLVAYSQDFFVGISTAQVLRNEAKFSGVLTNSFFNRHYYLNAKYTYRTGNIGIEPSALLKYAEHSPLSVDLGARFIYNNASWIGIWGRTSNSLVFQVGSNLVKNIYFSYSYEQSIGKLRNAASGSHEIHIGYYLGNNRNIKKEMK